MKFHICGLRIGLGSPDLLRGLRAPDDVVAALAGVEGAAGLIGVTVAALCLVPPAVAVVLAANLCVATIGATVDLQNLSNCFKYPLSKLKGYLD